MLKPVQLLGGRPEELGPFVADDVFRVEDGLLQAGGDFVAQNVTVLMGSGEHGVVVQHVLDGLSFGGGEIKKNLLQSLVYLSHVLSGNLQQGFFGEVFPFQDLSVAVAFRPDAVAELVEEARHEEHWHGVEDALLRAEDAALRDEQFHLGVACVADDLISSEGRQVSSLLKGVVTQDILLRNPFLEHQVLGLAVNSFVLKFPQHPLLELGERSQKRLKLFWW